MDKLDDDSWLLKMEKEDILSINGKRMTDKLLQ